MKKIFFLSFLFSCYFSATAQVMTPEKLWALERVSAVGLTNDAEKVIFRTRSYSIDENSGSSKTFVIPVKGGEPELVRNIDSILFRWKNFSFREVANPSEGSGGGTGQGRRFLSRAGEI